MRRGGGFCARYCDDVVVSHTDESVCRAALEAYKGVVGVRTLNGKRTSFRYKGRPFSYYGFLEKATRPTNMAYRRRVRLAYSEL